MHPGPNPLANEREPSTSRWLQAAALTELLEIECPAKHTCNAREWKGACASEWTTQSRCSAGEHGDQPNPAAVKARANGPAVWRRISDLIQAISVAHECESQLDGQVGA